MGETSLYLHIGLHKTGTTALQQFLWKNQQLLGSKEYFYFALIDHYLPWTLFPEDNFRYKSLKKPTNAIWAGLHQQIIRSGLENVILSSEEFCNISEIDKLGSQLQRYQSKIVIYLRRQDHLIQSIYGQCINDSTIRYTESIQELEHYRSKLDFANFLSPWRKVFGQENILVRVYEQGQLYGGGIYADFLETIGLELTDEYSLPEEMATNRSLNRNALEFLRLCNGIPMGVPEHRKLRQALDEISCTLGHKKHFESHQFLSPRERVEILEEYANSNHLVAQEYLGREDGQLFYEPWPDIEDPWKPYEGLAVEKVVQIIGKLWATQQREIRELNNQSIHASTSKELPRQQKKVGMVQGEIVALDPANHDRDLAIPREQNERTTLRGRTTYVVDRHRMQKTLVTGGFGFIGSHLVELLLEAKQKVHVVDNLSSNPLPVEFLLEEWGHPIDLSYDICDVKDFLNKEAYQFHLIYHLASVVGPAGILPYAGRITKLIVDDTCHIVDLALETKAKLVYVSSSEVYGGGDNGLCSEQMDKVIPAKTSVRTEYALGKLASEITIMNIVQVNDFQANIVRPFNVCGPRQSGRGGFVMPRFIGLAMMNEPLTVFGNGEQIRAFTHVAEIAEGIIKVGNAEKNGQVYNLGNPKNKISILDLAKTVIRVVGSDSEILFVDPKSIYGPLYGEAKDKYPQDALAINELEWVARKSVYTIVEETYSYMKTLQEKRPKVFYTLLGFAAK